MNYKQITMSLGLLILAGAAVVGGTIAFYSDTESSQGNVFAAGTIDLKVDHTRQTYNGVDCETCSLTLYSADGNTEVVDGENAEKDNFPFSAPEVSDPHENWDTHATSSWIWATEETREGDDGSDEEDTSYTFERTFQWNGSVSDVDFQLDVGSDNEYEVYLNDESVADGDGYDVIDNKAFTDNLKNGENTLTFVVTNKYNDEFPDSNNPEQNPGGLLYYLNIDREDCEEGADGFQDACMLWNETDLGDNHRFWTFGDIKPGDWGTNVISLHVYDNDAYMCLATFDEEQDSPNGGNIADNIEVFSWLDKNGDGEYNPNDDTHLGINTLSDSDYLVSFDPNNKLHLTGTSTEHVSLAWCAGEIDVDQDSGDISCDGSSVDNNAQGSSFGASLVAYVEQLRNNEEFNCEDRLEKFQADRENPPQ